MIGSSALRHRGQMYEKLPQLRYELAATEQ
jgi:hypothetical protein